MCAAGSYDLHRPSHLFCLSYWPCRGRHSSRRGYEEHRRRGWRACLTLGMLLLPLLQRLLLSSLRFELHLDRRARRLRRGCEPDRCARCTRSCQGEERRAQRTQQRRRWRMRREDDRDSIPMQTQAERSQWMQPQQPPLQLWLWEASSGCDVERDKQSREKEAGNSEARNSEQRQTWRMKHTDERQCTASIPLFRHVPAKFPLLFRVHKQAQGDATASTHESTSIKYP